MSLYDNIRNQHCQYCRYAHPDNGCIIDDEKKISKKISDDIEKNILKYWRGTKYPCPGYCEPDEYYQKRRIKLYVK